MTISATGEVKKTRDISGFTLIEVLLSLALLIIVFSLSLAVMPVQPSGPGGTAADIDDIVRNAMIEALATGENIRIQTEEDELYFIDSQGSKRVKTFEEGVQLLAVQDDGPLPEILIHRDAIHKAFVVRVGEEEIATYYPTMHYR